MMAADKAPVKRGRGRPRIYADAAEKRAAYMEKNDLVQVGFVLPRDVVNEFDEYMKRHHMNGDGLSRSQVIEKLIRKQLLRRR